MSGTEDRTVLTIGHSNHELAQLLSLLRAHGANAIADVRSSPYSRLNPQFNRESLQEYLKSNSLTYVFLGREMGGRPEDPSCYLDGQVDYRKLAGAAFFKNGLVRVINGAQTHRIALLCSEAEPLNCHRAILIAQELVAMGISVSHIHSDASLESHPEAMSRLVQLRGLAEKDLFRSKEEIIADACERQAGRIAYEIEELGEKAAM